jgi:ABC-type transport system involved in cytochrome bd biosynthesis fused ATPase/permease subunit
VILDALDDLMEGRTSFMIAHRLSTVRHADQIVVLSQGRVVERGSHDDLVQRDGIYHGLYLAQTKERRRRGTTTPDAAPKPAIVGNGEQAGTVDWRQV